MRFTIDRVPLGLSNKTPLVIDDARGSTLRVLRGRVWVTQEGCGDDVFLDPGSGHHFRSDGRVIVSVEGAADSSAMVVIDGPLSIHSRTSVRDLVCRVFDWKSIHGASHASAYGSP